MNVDNSKDRRILGDLKHLINQNNEFKIINYSPQIKNNILQDVNENFIVKTKLFEENECDNIDEFKIINFSPQIKENIILHTINNNCKIKTKLCEENNSDSLKIANDILFTIIDNVFKTENIPINKKNENSFNSNCRKRKNVEVKENVSLETATATTLALNENNKKARRIIIIKRSKNNVENKPETITNKQTLIESTINKRKEQSDKEKEIPLKKKAKTTDSNNLNSYEANKNKSTIERFQMIRDQWKINADPCKNLTCRYTKNTYNNIKTFNYKTDNIKKTVHCTESFTKYENYLKETVSSVSRELRHLNYALTRNRNIKYDQRFIRNRIEYLNEYRNKLNREINKLFTIITDTKDFYKCYGKEFISEYEYEESKYHTDLLQKFDLIYGQSEEKF